MGDEKYYNPNPWKTGGQSWQAPIEPGGMFGGGGGGGAVSFSPAAWEPQARQASPPRKPAWERPPSPVKQTFTPAPPKPAPAYQPPTQDMTGSLPTRPLWERLGMDPNPGAQTALPQPSYEAPAAAPAAPPAPVIPAPPPPPPVTSFPRMQLPKKKKGDNTMSAEEFERVRLFDSKATHNTVSPQVRRMCIINISPVVEMSI